MKTNLKTFPVTAPYSTDQLKFADSYISEILKWKEEFEAELREIRESRRNLALGNGRDVVPDLIGEILGEEASK